MVDPFMGLDFLAEAHRMLTAGGLLLLTVPTIEWGAPLRNRLGIDVMTTRFKLLGTEKTVVLPSLLHPRDRLEEMLRMTGFLDIRMTDGYLSDHDNVISPDIASVCEARQIRPTELPIIHLIRARR